MSLAFQGRRWVDRELRERFSLRQRPAGRYIPGTGIVRHGIDPLPALGADFTVTVPAGKVWRPISVLFSLVTSAVVGNRTQELAFQNPQGATFVLVHYNVQQAASLTKTYVAAPLGVLLPDLNNIIATSFPALVFLFPGFLIKSVTAGIDAGDQHGQPQYGIEEWDI